MNGSLSRARSDASGRPLRGALIGLGNVAVHGHIPGWEGFESAVSIVAAADPRPETGDVLARLHPAARWYASYDELLEREELDFVDICVPPALHVGPALAALERGLHVLCEKPLVLSAPELRRLEDASRERKVVLYTVHNWSHAPILSHSRALVRGGAVGDARRVGWEVLRDKPAAAATSGTHNWRVDPALAGGGILVDHGWHAFYIVPGWLPEMPHTLRATLTNKRLAEVPREGMEDTASVTLTGRTCETTVSLTWAADERRNRATVVGSEGTLLLDGATLILERTLDTGWTPDEPAVGAARAQVGPRSWRWDFPQSLTMGSHHPDWFHGVVRGFFDEIANPEVRGRNLAEAAACLTMITAAKLSSEKGEAPVDLELGTPVAGPG